MGSGYSEMKKARLFLQTATPSLPYLKKLSRLTTLG